MKEDGLTVVNAAADHWRSLPLEGRRTLTYGVDAPADLRAEALEPAPHGTRFHIALADEYAVFEEDATAQAQERAYALGQAGQIDEGRAVLEEELEFSPGDADLLNASCWYDAIWDRVSEETIDRCTRAVEGMENSEAALDSRALALFRLGRSEEALRDLDRVLSRAPDMVGSRYLRGVIRSQTGDAEGAREDIEIAQWVSPVTPRQYALWGLKPR